MKHVSQFAQAARGPLARYRARALSIFVLLAGSVAAVAPVHGNPVEDLKTKLEAAVPPNTRLVVAEQNDQASIPWKLSGADQGVPYDITFATFNGGPAVLEALISGAADIGYIGEAPLPIAISAGVEDLVAVALNANPGSPANTFLAVRPGSGVEKVEDLRGKTVAYPPGTGRHMILAGILHEHGLTLNQDVTGVAVTGAEVAPTFASGAVDAAILLGHQYFRIGEPEIIDDGQGHNWGVNVLLVRKSLLADPAKSAAVADFLRRAIQFFNWQGANQDEWIRARYVGQQGLTFEQGKWLEEAIGHGTFYPITPRAAEVLQEIADGLLATGALKKKINIAPYLDDRFNEIVLWQNAADGVEPKPLENPGRAAKSNAQ